MNLSLLFALKVIVFGCALQQTIVAVCGILKVFAILSVGSNRKAGGNFSTSIILWTIFYALCALPANLIAEAK